MTDLAGRGPYTLKSFSALPSRYNKAILALAVFPWARHCCRRPAIAAVAKGAQSMTRILKLLAVLTAAFAFALPAHATSTRTFVSSTGSDTNTCTITAPCATFARAYTQTTASGIIAALDPGKYGPLTIGMPITINGNGWAAITGTAAGNGITISNSVPAGTIVILNGIEIDGAGAAYNGIAVFGPAALTVSNCNIQNFVLNGQSAFSGNGILLAPANAGTFTATITNTTVSNNANDGISYTAESDSAPPATIIIDRVVATDNGNGGDGNGAGIVINSGFTSGGTTTVGISNTITSDNGSGLVIENGNPTNVSIDNLNATANVNGGIAVSGTASVLLGRSVITANGTGVTNNTSGNTFYTYKNNQINLNNGADGYGSLNVLSPE
jgi:hypothetical protein